MNEHKTIKDAKDVNDKIGSKINPIPVPETNIGIDTQDDFYKTLAEAGTANAIDISAIESFSQLSQNRETLYQVLDTMSEDPTIAGALEIYAEDVTQPNDTGDIVWCESSDPDVSKFVTFLLNSLNVNKNIYGWAHSLIKYGDLYLRLYRQSDFDDALFGNDSADDKENSDRKSLTEKFNHIDDSSNSLNENVVIKAYKKSDNFINYVEQVPNPGEMFELTKFGKSYAYIKTNTTPTPLNKDVQLSNSSYYTYRFKRNDVEVYNAVTYVHACLQDDTPRTPEQIQLYNVYSDDNNNDLYTYQVRRGQSILYNTYKIWRQMMLLENALLLNRITKSSILRVIEVEVADMPKERVGPHLQRIKSLVEQKSSITDGNNMSEYTNPGALENNIYVPTHNGVGAINTQQIGGDVNVRDIADIEYFKQKLYSSLRIPKQFLGDTEDSTGFNGGTSLSIVSSRYAKTVRRLQATLCQVITDCINILLLDRGQDAMVNKFTIAMQAPVTQEELDKRDNVAAKVQLSDDVLRMVESIEDEVVKLKILKALLSNAITNQEVIELIQEYIDDKEAEQEENPEENNVSDNDDDIFGDDEDFDFGGGDFDFGDSDIGSDTSTPSPTPNTESSEDTSLPTPADLNAGDFTELV